MAYKAKTLRRMSPLARKVARLINEGESVTRRLKNVLGQISSAELDSIALTANLRLAEAVASTPDDEGHGPEIGGPALIPHTFTFGETRSADESCWQCESKTEVFTKIGTAPSKANEGAWFCINSCGPKGLSDLLKL